MLYRVDETDWAYLAGLIDGEGCISTCIKKARGLVNVGVHLVITNTNREVLDWIHRTLTGLGRIGRVLEKRYDKRRLPCFQYVLGANAHLLFLLRQVRPYLRIKREQADLALAYLESRTKRLQRATFTDNELALLFALRVKTQQDGGLLKYLGETYTQDRFIELVRSGRRVRRPAADWTPEMLDKLGTTSDQQLATEFGITRYQVQERRLALGLRRFSRAGLRGKKVSDARR